MDRSIESLERKFSELAKKKTKTGDPTFSPMVQRAKMLMRRIVEATDGLEGRSGPERDEEYNEFDNEDDKDLFNNDYLVMRGQYCK